MYGYGSVPYEGHQPSQSKCSQACFMEIIMAQSKTERNYEIFLAHMNGMNFTEIAKKYGISRQRAIEIFHRIRDNK